MSKLLFFDIDGTLIPSIDGAIDDKTMASLKAAKAKGHKLFINTGRTFCMLPSLIVSDLFDGYVCGLSTHLILDNQTLFHQGIDKKRCLEICEMARECSIDVIMESKNMIFFPKNPLYLDNSLRNIYIEQKVANYDLDDEKLEGDKFCVAFNQDSDFKAFKAHVEVDMDLVLRNDVFAEAALYGFDKSKGIQMLQEHLNVALDDVYVFGDSTNDLGMMRYAVHAVGMGNGDEAIFPYCEFKTKALEDDGITYALKHYGLI